VAGVETRPGDTAAALTKLWIALDTSFNYNIAFREGPKHSNTGYIYVVLQWS